LTAHSGQSKKNGEVQNWKLNCKQALSRNGVILLKEYFADYTKAGAIAPPIHSQP